jgi:hypothetical protein
MRLALVLQIVVLCGAFPAGAITPMSPLRCTVDHMVNELQGELVMYDGRSAILLPTDLKVDGDYFTGRRAFYEAHLTDTIDYRIARATLHFEGTMLREHHGVGEKQAVRLTGTCAHKVP